VDYRERIRVGGQMISRADLVAVVEALCEPEYSLHGASASTGGSAPFIVVNGPLADELGMEALHSVFASGNRANATIGRAVRLILNNVLGTIPGQMDRSTLGHPGKISFCIAEDEADSPWPSLARERGVAAGESAVSVMAAESPHQILNEWTQDPRELLETLAASIRANMLTYSIWAGNYALIVPRQPRDVLTAAGWSKRDIREYIFESARVTRRQWRDVGKAAIAARRDEDQVYTALRTPDDLLVVAARLRGLGGVPEEGDDGLVVQLGVVEPVEGVDGAGPAGDRAAADRRAAVLDVGARGERGGLLMADLHELGVVPLGQGGEDAADAVPGVAVEAVHAPRCEAVQHVLGDVLRCTHAHRLPADLTCRSGPTAAVGAPGAPAASPPARTASPPAPRGGAGSATPRAPGRAARPASG